MAESNAGLHGLQVGSSDQIYEELIVLNADLRRVCTLEDEDQRSKPLPNDINTMYTNAVMHEPLIFYDYMHTLSCRSHAQLHSPSIFCTS